MNVKETSSLNIRAVVMSEETGKRCTYFMCVPWVDSPPEVTPVRLDLSDWKGEHPPRQWDIVLLKGVTERTLPTRRARKLKATGWYAHEGYPWKPEHERLIRAEVR